MLKIRRYQPEDSETVKELHYTGIAQMREPTPEVLRNEDRYFIDSDFDDIEGAYINKRGDFLVGIQDGEIVVTGAIRKHTETCGELKRLRVRRDYQRQGYGETMMRKLIERGRELGYRELILDTLASNTASQRLFEKCGFSELRRESLGPFKLIIYGMELNEGGK
jgi:ribosomal protein S18 acetylase RimI-like enzyme